MIYSMTGFGRGGFEAEKSSITIEIKSVNHRYTEIVTKMPKKFYAFEEKMKSIIKGSVNRGRFEVYVNYKEEIGENYDVKPNFELMDKYHATLMEVKNRYDLSDKPSISLVSRFPDAITIEYKETDEEEIWKVIEPALKHAVIDLVKMREIEGIKLEEDVLKRIDLIRETLGEIEKLCPMIVENYKKRITDRINEILSETAEIDEAKVAHEVAIFADKTSIAEEVVRLDSHFEQMKDIFKVGGAIGRKLDFLIQEMNREVNTIGSKSPDFDISNYVVDMKSEIEKIREQIQNIE